MTTEQLRKKWPSNKNDNDDDLVDFVDERLNPRYFKACCGLSELEFDDGLRLLELYIDDFGLTLSKKLLFDILLYLLTTTRVAAIILSDVKQEFTKINKLLSEIVPPIVCGKNPKSNRVIYLWVVSLEALKNYKKTLKIK